MRLVVILSLLLASACGGDAPDEMSGTPPAKAEEEAGAKAGEEAEEKKAPSTAEEIEQLVRDLLEGASRDVRLVASVQLQKIGAAAVPALTQAIERPDVRGGSAAWTIEVLGVIGEPSAPAAPELGRRLLRGGRFAQLIAWALGRIGAASVPFLAEALSSEATATRVYAADALQRLAEAAAPAADQLIAVLGDPDPVVRTYASQALARMPSASARSVPRLLEATRDDDDSVRHAAGTAIATLAGKDPAVLERLRQMVRDDPDDHVRATMLDELDTRLGQDPEALDFLRELAALVEEELGLARKARWMLLERGVDDPDLVTWASKTEAGTSFEELLGRARGLAKAGPNGRRAALPMLVRVLDWAPDSEDRVAAVEALARLGKLAAGDEKAMQALGVHADEANEKPEVVAASRAALEQIKAAK